MCVDVCEPPESYYQCGFACMHVCLSTVVFVLPGGIHLFVRTFVRKSMCTCVIYEIVFCLHVGACLYACVCVRVLLSIAAGNCTRQTQSCVTVPQKLYTFDEKLSQRCTV